MLSSPSGSPSLLQAIVAHYDELIGYVRRRFGDKAFAQEVVHEVCLKVLKNPAPAQDIQIPLAFLRRMAMHTAIDRCRSERAYAGLIDTTDCLPGELACDGGGASGLTSPELAALRQQREQALLCAIRGLPPRSQEVFILIHLYHMPQAEVADKLRISRGMIARHLARSLEDILPVLHDHD
ncbi:sigma-70 family RNA polymerase sigma factor [Pseudothauera nasutitermitis]|uniref:Sigma-70 family RNA polymerase sigma factor n=1 Tax=Pseudothauera nasutitermitis TaxID=2565930 RepID=A0A4S4AZ45_9RHOO|nr:sigma-70 family RNA polymerase sigma factor [Pseudothauera nasutitermitis]THF65413.1 sigma-70 family RNA polymerase sigma factor [Pseudothauera nasutitermitis]